MQRPKPLPVCSHVNDVAHFSESTLLAKQDRWALNFLRDFTGETTLPPRQLQHPKHATTQGIRPQADILQESGPGELQQHT